MTPARSQHWETVGVGVFLGIATTVVYQWLAAYALQTRASTPWWLGTVLDAHVPRFVPAVWLYCTWYIAIPLLAFGGQTTIRRGYFAFAIAFVACTLGHLFLPVTIERPPVDSSRGISEALLAFVYRMDLPTNLFPSFHAAGAAILFGLQGGRRLRFPTGCWAVGVCAACVMIKQHYVADVVAGMVIGLGAATQARRMVRDSTATTLAMMRGRLAERAREGPFPVL